MKTLVVYYSLEGNTEYVANIIKEKTGADTLRLVPKKAYADKGFAKFFWGGKSAVMAEKPALEDITVDLSAYDQIVLGFPVWAGTFAPPLRTFVEDNAAALKGKHLSTYACQGGSGAEKAFVKLSKTLGIESFEHTAIFNDPKARPEEGKDAQIEEFCKALVD
ncbi:MAG: flavodoxin [Lachnospiraceae bacterium]|nr:flavodoxin [Lachnospiraceae bacterium]